MKNFGLACVLFALSTAAFAVESEKLFELNDGRLVVGEILQEGEDSYLVKTETGSVVRIPFSDIQNVSAIEGLGSVPEEENHAREEEESRTQEVAPKRAKQVKRERTRAVNTNEKKRRAQSLALGALGDSWGAGMRLEYMIDTGHLRNGRDVSKWSSGLFVGVHSEYGFELASRSAVFVLGDSRRGLALNSSLGFVYDGLDFFTLAEVTLGGKMTFNKKGRRWRGLMVAGEFGVGARDELVATGTLQVGYGF